MHDDHHPSLAVSERENKVLLRCVPCEATHDTNTGYVTAVLSALGLRWSDLLGESDREDPCPHLPVDYYAYRDAQGVERFYVRRYESPKRFDQCRVERAQA